jgi:hypothetical protein
MGAAARTAAAVYFIAIEQPAVRDRNPSPRAERVESHVRESGVIYIFAYFTARAYQQLKTFLISTTCYSRQIESIPLGGVTLAANFNLIKPAACMNSDACRRLVKFNSHARVLRIRMCACLGEGGERQRV